MERERNHDRGVQEEAENLCSPFCSKPGRNSPKIDRSFHASGLTARTVGEFQDRFGQYYGRDRGQDEGMVVFTRRVGESGRSFMEQSTQ